MKIKFIAIQDSPDNYQGQDNYIVLIKRDNWNDYGFQTLCDIHILKPYATKPLHIGHTKISYFGQKAEDPWVFDNGPAEFDDLRQQSVPYCSVSSNIEYYKSLRLIDEEFALQFLECICDAICDDDIWKKFKDQEVFKTSLLRSHSSVLQTRDVFPTLFGNQAAIVSKFSYKVMLEGAESPHQVKLDFSHDAIFPYRVNLLTGVNGTGKTQILSKLALALTGFTSSEPNNDEDLSSDHSNAFKREKIMSAGSFSTEPSFYGVIAVSFNAFDDFEKPQNRDDDYTGYTRFKYSYCGLQTSEGNLKDYDELLNELNAYLSDFSSDMRSLLLEILNNIFPTIDLEFVFFEPMEAQNINSFYLTLSAGQRIILNIIVSLIYHLKRRTLVLMDEPETHLHPMLMATLITAINKLLEEKDSYAVIASHSPIIAQQTSSRRIQILGRQDNTPFTLYPDIECFGENLSIITSSLYGAVEGERDYTDVIKKSLIDPNKKQELEARVDELGTNAKMYLRSKLRA